MSLLVSVVDSCEADGGSDVDEARDEDLGLQDLMSSRDAYQRGRAHGDDLAIRHDDDAVCDDRARDCVDGVSLHRYLSGGEGASED
jgi:hypothetical protein